MKLSLIVIPLVASIALAQSPVAPNPSAAEFEVASVKQNTSGSMAAFNRASPGGRLTITNVPLRTLIMDAYGLVPNQITGGPSWLSSERWDIAAKAEGNPGPAEMKLMLQSLLVSRFELRFHYETKQMSIYALVQSKQGIENAQGLVKSKDGSCSMFLGDRPVSMPRVGEAWGDTPCGHVNFRISQTGATLHAQGASLSQLARALSTAIDPASCSVRPSACRPVVNKTGIEGTFDIDMLWTPDPMPGAQPSGDPGPSIFKAIQEELGLKLESQRGPVDAFVIDQVEKPAEN